MCDNCIQLISYAMLTTPSAGYYVKVMKKIQDKGDEYIKNEDERLGRILGKCYCEREREREREGERERERGRERGGG